MPYYPTIEEDLARAKEIIEKDRRMASRWGGAIYGADIPAAYELLKSFVEVVELIGPAVIKTALRAQRLSDNLAEKKAIEAGE